MADKFTRELVKVCVAQICQVIGWNSIQTTSLELITDILQDYIRALARNTHNYAILYGQTEPNLDHLGLAFRDMRICLIELEEYVKYVDTTDTVLEIPKYPIARVSHLNHLKPGSREVVTRPVHIHEHLPPMHPHLEDQEYSLKQSPVTVDVMSNTESTSPLSNSKTGVFKRPGDPISDGSQTTRRPRHFFEEETRPLRELSSVMMTTSGFLSPAREGKLPEARTPPIQIDPIITTPEPVVNNNNNCNNNNNTPVAEIKTEKKKKMRSLIDSVKKLDKENKVKEEVANDGIVEEDNRIVKKLASMKETSKLKAFKSGALKIASPAVTKVAKVHLQKLKSPIISNSTVNVNTPKANKLSRSKSPKSDKTIGIPSVKDQHVSCNADSSNSSNTTDGKLLSEPNKQKLNIFRKITKVKEEHAGGASVGNTEVLEAKPELEEVHESSWTPVDETIEAVIQKGRIEVKEEDEVKDDRLDIVATESPPQFDPLLYSDDQSISGTPTTPRTPELPKLTEHKKKKKDKHKDKHAREVKEKYTNNNQSPKLNKYVSDSEMIGKPKTPDVDLTPDESTPPPVFPFFTPFPSAPGLIPPPISHPLIPHLPLTLGKHSSIPNLSLHTPILPPVVPSHHNVHEAQFQSSPSSSSPTPTSSTNTAQESNPPSVQQTIRPIEVTIVKKKEHKKDKKLKEKMKRKKEKKEKSKSKDKSEKKKIKLEKKERDKEKSKLKKEKKEKKKDKELHDDKMEINVAVPKITLKLGPASPQESSPDSTLRKIVIKPFLKKEDECISVKSERSQSPELARISPLVPRPTKHKPIKNTIVDEVVRPVHSTTQPLLPLVTVEKQEPLPVDNDGNEVWICPGCGRQDDGSPMVGCDGCDAWYHWVCVGIQVPPESSQWFCPLCITKKANEDIERSDKKKKNRKKKLPH